MIQALQQQSEQVTAGQIGAPPAPAGQSFQYTLNVAGKLSDPDEFADVIVKAGQAGEITRVRDVATRRARSRRPTGRCSRSTASRRRASAIFQAPGANALDVAGEVEQEDGGTLAPLPAGLHFSIPYNTTNFIEDSINEVYKTLWQAAMLVLIVILVFLQNFRATLVPATTVPVTIIGAFAGMAALGYTVNLSTLFALIWRSASLSTMRLSSSKAGRKIEQGMSGHDTAIKAMDELFGPIIGITLVLMAVFLPSAFVPGLSGQMFAQFALVIAVTALISAVNAATLKPTQAHCGCAHPCRRSSGISFIAASTASMTGSSAGIRRLIVRHGRSQRADGWSWRWSLIAVTGCGFSRGADRLPADRRPGLHDRRWCSCPTAHRSSARRRSSTGSTTSAARRRASRR